jgi:hypothetical protein
VALGGVPLSEGAVTSRATQLSTGCGCIHGNTKERLVQALNYVNTWFKGSGGNELKSTTDRSRDVISSSDVALGHIWDALQTAIGEKEALRKGGIRCQLF